MSTRLEVVDGPRAGDAVNVVVPFNTHVMLPRRPETASPGDPMPRFTYDYYRIVGDKLVLDPEYKS